MHAVGHRLVTSVQHRAEKVKQQVDHIGRHMRTIALQSAVGGMALSGICMAFAAAGYLSPAAGALAQEAIDVAAVLNALRVGTGGPDMTDY